jgi:hypothetical protein
VVQQPNCGLGRLICEVSRSHTDTRPRRSPLNESKYIKVLYLIILFNLIVPTLLSLVGDPLSGNRCGSPNHIYVISLLLVALLTQFIPDN